MGKAESPHQRIGPNRNEPAEGSVLEVGSRTLRIESRLK